MASTTRGAANIIVNKPHQRRMLDAELMSQSSPSVDRIDHVTSQEQGAINSVADAPARLPKATDDCRCKAVTGLVVFQ
jgi:hypothetical protein